MLSLNTLNDAQKCAVTADRVPLLVLAGPGSGKTTVVLQRIFYLLEIYRIEPERILALTFTKDAARSMAERFKSQTNGSLPVFFGTFHSCFYQILKYSGQFRSYSLLDPIGKRQLLKEACSKYVKVENLNDLSEFLEGISYYKNTDDLNKSLLHVSAKNRMAFEKIYTHYEALRKSYKKLDFDDMVLECRNLLLEDQFLREQWQKRYDFILLDEFQDINAMQYETLKLLAPPGSASVFAVGDDDQSIYGFRGANPGCLKRFEKEYHANRVTLNINYRSCESIVQSAVKVIVKNKERYCKELQAAGESGRGLILTPFRAASEQLKFIHTFYTQNNEETFAVLFRTNLQMQRYAIFFTKNGIPFQIRENGQSVYQHFVAKDLFAYLKWISGNEERNLFFGFMNKPFRGINRENVDHDPKAERLKKDLRSLRGKPLFLQLQYLLHKLQYNLYLKEKAGQDQEKMDEWVMVRDILLEDAGRYTTFDQWEKGIAEYQSIKTKDETKDKKTLILLTAHASKGLEFDHVWIPDCNEGMYPHQLMPDLESCEEERRIFYVAMTRAKKSLDLTYLVGDKNRSRSPSRFLTGFISGDDKNKH